MEQVIDGTDTLRDQGPAARSARSRSRRCRASWRRPGLDEVRPHRPGHHPGRGLRHLVIAFQDALRLIRSGECDVVLAGGSEAPLLPMAFAALGNMGALSKRNDDPTHASRPFDRDRDGFVFGEGAGVVVVESAEHALARGATPILAEVIGAALTADAFHISAPEPTGRGATRAMTKALRDAGVAPDEIDYIVAHGTSTPLNDVDRDARDQGGVRRARLQASRSARPSRWSATCSARPASLSALAAIGAIRDGRHPADDQPRRRPTRSATSTTCPTSRARRGSTRR